MKKNIWIFFTVYSLLLIADFFLNYFLELNYAGFWTDRIFFWLWFCSLIAILVILRNKLLSKIVMITLAILLIISAITVLPGLLLLSLTTGIGRIAHFKLDSEYRIDVFAGVMSRQQVFLFQRNGIFEKEVDHVMEFDVDRPIMVVSAREITDAKLLKKTDSTVVVRYSTENKSFEYTHRLLKTQ